MSRKSTFIPQYFFRMWCIALLLPALLSCSKHPVATQAAARVGDAEITVHQINDEISRQPQASGQDAKEIARSVLENLINLQVLANKATENQLDRDPDVMRAMERAKRMILAQAYIERYVPKPAEPSEDQIHEYFTNHPELFAQRKAYHLLQVIFPVSALSADIKGKLERAKTKEDVFGILNGNKIQFQQQEITRLAEDIPSVLLALISNFQRGQMYLAQNKAQVELTLLMDSSEQPLTEQQVAPKIHHFIVNKNREDAINAEVKRLRAATTIEYKGDFAKDKEAAQIPSASDAGQNAATPESGTVAPQRSASSPHKDSIDRGVSGFDK